MMQLEDSRNEYFLRLYEPNHSSALAYAKRLAYNEEEARDLLQDSLESALKAFGTLRKAESFKPWFFRVIRNRFLNSYRRKKLSRRFEFHAEPTGSLGLEDMALERAKLSSAMDVLSAEEREALILFEVEGFQIREIAKLQSRSVAGIKYRLRQARQKLQGAYFSDGIPPGARSVCPAVED